MNLSRGSLVLDLLVGLAVGLALPVFGTARAAGAELSSRGEAIFKSKCAACHSVGQGRRVGPDLKGVLARRPKAWLEKFIRAPGKLIDAGDPTAAALLKEFGNMRMPTMGLSEDDVRAVLAYLEAAGGGGGRPPAHPTGAWAGTTGAAGAQPAPAAAARAAGSPQAGKALFVGSARLAAGGPPCISCHSVRGVGLLGGGTLGPDLTTVATRFGRQGLAGVLSSLPFPTMRPVYAGRPLSAREQADLLAFFEDAAQGGQGAGTSRSGFFWLGLGGFVVLVALPPVVWRDRFGSARRRLVGGA